MHFVGKTETTHTHRSKMERIKGEIEKMHKKKTYSSYWWSDHWNENKVSGKFSKHEQHR